jgi:mono/diheme cytochrome c family protein
MNFRIAALVIASTGIGASYGQGLTTIKKVPVIQTSPISGAEMFNAYCAVCHGQDGKGAGPAADALKVSPTDLTRLASRNNGKFPDQRVSLVISTGPAETLAQGSKEMPAWGELFKHMGSSDAGVARIRVMNLTDYVRSIQAK